ncbi:MAG TPA: hypothetical protein VH813_02565 [Candidatus Limnocylindrales bacterium]|jgi:hypothetical protein
MTSRRILSLITVTVLVAACSGPGASEPTPPPSATPSPIVIGGSGGPSVLPVAISPDVAVGPQRFLFGIVDPSTNLPIAAPDRAVAVRFVPSDGGAAIDAGPATFVWGIVNERGIYVSEVDFPKAGKWTAEFTTPGLRGAEETIRLELPVAETRSAIALGEKAPSVATPTADDVGGDLSRLSTDAHPLAAFYRTSEAQALKDGDPFVLVFATPKFCQTAQCGPTLDRLKPFVERYPSVTFIHVEPYQLTFDQDQLQPVLDVNQQLQTVPAVDDFGLLAEPWVYVVDRDGIVRGSFELIFSDDELTAALDEVK